MVGFSFTFELSFMYCLYCYVCFQTNCNLEPYYEVLFYWSCVLSLSIYYSTFYCCHVWIGALNIYLDILDQLQKRVCKTVGSLIGASLHHSTQHQNRISQLLFYFLLLWKMFVWPNCINSLELCLWNVIQDSLFWYIAWLFYQKPYILWGSVCQGFISRHSLD